LGKTLLPRGESRNARADLPLAGELTPEPASLVESDHAKELQSEIELLRQVGQGGRRSFEQLYERFSGVLFSIAYGMLKSQPAAEDVLQDVFVQIWKKAPLFDPARGRPMT
jgi:hypothetical protein